MRGLLVCQLLRPTRPIGDRGAPRSRTRTRARGPRRRGRGCEFRGDLLLVQGLYQIKPSLPFTPGMEVAGTVRAIGAGRCRRRGGDPLALVLRWVRVRRSCCRGRSVGIPRARAAGQAAGLVQSYATMLFALTRRTTVAAGERVRCSGPEVGSDSPPWIWPRRSAREVVALPSSRAKLEAPPSRRAPTRRSRTSDGATSRPRSVR